MRGWRRRGEKRQNVGQNGPASHAQGRSSAHWPADDVWRPYPAGAKLLCKASRADWGQARDVTDRTEGSVNRDLALSESAIDVSAVAREVWLGVGGR